MVMTNITAIAKTIDELVHRTADDKFEMDAKLYGCDPDGAYLLGESPNPYDLLECIDRPEQLDAVALVVTGYAAPEGGTTPPREHPERIRVRLVVCKNIDGFSNIMRREDTPDEVEDLGDGGVGVMRDAMEAWWAQ
jgi:hypothetical protein